MTALEFWKHFSEVQAFLFNHVIIRLQKLPKLTLVVRKYLPFQASSSSSERAFSTLRFVATDLRNRMSPEKISHLICIRSLLSAGLMPACSATKDKP